MWAQTNFRPGYVVSLTGDTLRGEVDSRDSRLSAQRCLFRVASSVSPTSYSATELRGYGLPAEHKHYRACSVPVAAGTQPVFLEVLVDGPAILYFWRDAKKREFYYVASPTVPLAELKYQVVTVVRDGHPYLEEQTDYRNTLATALAGCLQAQRELPTLLFTVRTLQKVVTMYNACQGHYPSQQQQLIKTRLTFGVLAGAARSALTYDGTPYVDGAVTAWQTGMAIGPQVRVGIGSLSGKLSLSAAMLYQPEKYELINTALHNGAPADVHYRCRFDIHYLRVPVMLRYTYPRSKIAPLAEAGFNLAYAIRNNNSVEVASYTPQYAASAPLLEGNAFNSFQVGLGAGLGVCSRIGGHAVALLGRADITNGVSGTALVKTSVMHFYGLLSIDFTK